MRYYKKERRDPAGMGYKLPSTLSMLGHDWGCGIHGAARWRRGMKRGAATARRRLGQRIIEEQLRQL
jgi:hypothetical protein